MAKKKRQSDPHDGSDSSTESGNERTQGGSKNGCQHVKKSVDVNCIKKAIKHPRFDAEKCNECYKTSNSNAVTVEQLETDDFEYDRTLWLCLKCGACNCGRTVNKHALAHYEVSFNVDFVFHKFTNVRAMCVKCHMISCHLIYII